MITSSALLSFCYVSLFQLQQQCAHAAQNVPGCFMHLAAGVKQNICREACGISRPCCHRCIWKDGHNAWQAFLDVCPHRLIPLSEGRITDNKELQCAYHGWLFESSGKCTAIPQGGNVNNPRTCATVYQCAVKQGEGPCMQLHIHVTVILYHCAVKQGGCTNTRLALAACERSAEKRLSLQTDLAIDRNMLINSDSLDLCCALTSCMHWMMLHVLHLCLPLT